MDWEPLDSKEPYLVTCAAGFIGSYLCKLLLEEGCRVIGIDNMNDYYDVGLKESRLDLLGPYESFSLIRSDISDKEIVEKAFENYHQGVVVNLAAQAGSDILLRIPMSILRATLWVSSISSKLVGNTR